MSRPWFLIAILAAALVEPNEALAQITRPPMLGSQARFAQLPPTASQPQQLPTYVDLDRYEAGPAYYYAPAADDWSFQLLPDGLVYDNYLAGTKESRFSSHIIKGTNDSWLFDATLGARVGLLRYGSNDPFRPEGWQIDAEGSAQARLDIPDDVDVRGTDYRAGLPITYGSGNHRWKLAYYHLSSHIGDEFLMKNPGFTRVNYARDVFVLGYGYYVNPRLRVYAEAGWAFASEVSEPWEFQFGLDYAPCGPTGLRGQPFFALNGSLRQEVDFGGGLSVQTGWAWRGDNSSNMLRMGLHYYNGKSNQFSFFDEHEQQIGYGVWYDF